MSKQDQNAGRQRISEVTDVNLLYEVIMEVALKIKFQVTRGEDPYVDDAAGMAQTLLRLDELLTARAFDQKPVTDLYYHVWEGLPNPWAGRGSRPELKEMAAYAFVTKGSPGAAYPLVLVLNGTFDVSDRDGIRKDICTDLGADHVWFEDEQGTDLDWSGRLPRHPRHPELDHDRIPPTPFCTCYKSKTLCRLHGRRAGK